MKLRIHREGKTRTPGKKLQALFARVVEEEGNPDWPGSVNLVFTTDRKIRILNRQWRGFDTPTDVLSFNVDEPHEEGVFGEIYISIGTASRQAKEQRKSLIDEYLWLFCHGMLHLFGYDHKKTAEAARMKAREQYFLAELEG